MTALRLGTRRSALAMTQSGHVADALRAAGHEVELFGMQHPENPAGLPLADTFPGLVELERGLG